MGRDINTPMSSGMASGFFAGGVQVEKLNFNFREGQILKEKIEILAPNLYHPFEF